jgi:hypothetical protein
VPLLVRVVIAVIIALVILRVGMAMLRSLGGAARAGGPQEPEDVSDLAVSFVCRECGTELAVKRLGEIQVPRHCGEVMAVVRRSEGGSALPG